MWHLPRETARSKYKHCVLEKGSGSDPAWCGCEAFVTQLYVVEIYVAPATAVICWSTVLVLDMR